MSSIDVGFSGEISRKDHPMILSSNRQLASILGVRLAYNSAGYPAGQVLALNSVSGLYDKYNDSASSGLDTARGVLLRSVEEKDFVSSGDSQAAQVVFGGEVFKSKLTGLDANAETDLDARTITVAGGTQILKF